MFLSLRRDWFVFDGKWESSPAFCIYISCSTYYCFHSIQSLRTFLESIFDLFWYHCRLVYLTLKLSFASLPRFSISLLSTCTFLFFDDTIGKARAGCIGGHQSSARYDISPVRYPPQYNVSTYILYFSLPGSLLFPVLLQLSLALPILVGRDVRNTNYGVWTKCRKNSGGCGAFTLKTTYRKMESRLVHCTDED